MRVAYRESTLERFDEWADEARDSATGFVYFVQGGKYVKIGYTQNESVDSRIRSLQTGCPFQLRLLAVYPGNEKFERRLHRMFGPWRMQGEWFRLSAPAMRQVVERINERLF